MTDAQLDVQQTEKTSSNPQKLTNNKEIIAYLAEKFPLCFILEGEAKPLKIGLFQDLVEALKEDERVSKTQLRHALRQYTSNWRYLHGCREGAERVDLYGNPAGVLDAEHVAHAAEQLAEAKAKFAEKRKAELVAKKAQQKRQPRRQNNLKSVRKPKVELSAVDLSTLSKGAAVKVKVGDRAKKGIVVEVLKDSARVELENGLVMNITSDRLFA
ncbi:RNA chaperone ProQ [Rodentibacter caecimuris]|uniref:RNA chaperone ProQ n=1 Tax=Rodentibacter caecimuris TaxID=1796644 RepID=A0AAJ3N003_9PAST|nr:RNA chaperone ProQ [Rodentibacter heylii]AOF54135.1 ProQ: influences osmotic activation of compatible solute ProP [Pasteurellaceae bacterium NI1060]OOF70099.1 RNA chaperone ProQ [Rodentibacter heylii]OOF75088.1 RNA chaperone ProQ [Rodentibacter heylii]OOF76017.1 RNA chaperone ProQ [Rodentibacter heylii]